MERLMLHMSKEEKDIYIDTLISNLANDKKCFNMQNRKQFTSHHEASSYLREELEELEEEIKNLTTDFKMYWHFTKHEQKCAPTDYERQLKFIADRCKNVVNEALDTWSVALKALDQMKDWEE